MTTNTLFFRKAIYICSVFFLCLLSQGCSVKQGDLKKIIQTSSASEIDKYKDGVIEDLKAYKRKLDLRNPYSFDPELKDKIVQEIDSGKNTINLIQDDKELTTENEYLHYAFSPEHVKYRNDLLILGLYKIIYKAYDLSTDHKFTAIEYNSKSLQQLYKYLQVVRWKILTNKDNEGKYIFLTWQNNWQVELMKNPTRDLNTINELNYIKQGRETLFDHSNFSFEVLITRMLLNVKYSLEETNIEPVDMSVSALKTFAFII
ncbi:hypothetical protein [Vibrio salinus]|uniref:hypothetical protein n=1 Tax=Vibrio salinus TaxID=2899784 RepID=UPI001E48FD66|nr:hypothetical protein [Vibrio salinus]MCE0494422.1 hypothetical protein [Vibrio salinus]